MIKFRPTKIIAAGVVLAAITLGACGTGASSQEAAQAPANVPAAAEATATSLPPTATPTLEPTPEPTSEPAATSTPPPSPTFQPSTASVAQPSHDSADGASAALVERFAEQGMEYLTDFTRDFSPRASGSEGERRAAEFLEQEMERLGYEAELQPFTVDFIPPDVPVVTLLSPEERDIRSLPMTLSGMGRASGPLVHVGKAYAEDIPAEGLDGKVALIQRGEITFEEKVSRVADAGAVAAIVYNNVPGGFGGTLMNQGTIPAASISKEDGEAILAMMEQGVVQGQVTVRVETRDTQNLIAEKPGAAGDERVVVIGAHYDTVLNTQAAGDNGSGVVSLVMLAREIADKDFPFTVRFVFFGVEEIGLFGSRFYVDSLSQQERDNIIAMLNFDAMGAGKAAILGDEELTSKVMDYATANGLDVQRSPGLRGGGSDHASFQAVGIPAIFFFGSDFSRINSPADTLEFVQPEIMGTHITLGLALLDMLAKAED